MKKFLFSNCTIIQDRLFLVGIFGGLPANMDLSNGKIVYYDTVKGFVYREKSTVVDYLDSFQDKVYALDSGEGNLVIWNLNNLTCQYIPLGCSQQPWINFSAFERYQSDYYIFPKYENKLIIFHTNSNEITEISGYLNSVETIQCACRVKDNVFLLPEDSDVIYCYELPTGKKKIFDLKRTVRNCVHAVFYEQYIYILNKYGAVYRWNLKKAEMEKIISSEAVPDEKGSMGRIICAGNKLILLPAYGKDIKIWDLLTEEMEVYHDYPDDYDDQTDWWKYYGYCKDKLYYYFAISAGNYLLKIEKRTGRLVWIKPNIDSLGGKTIELLKKRILHESDFWDLFDLMQLGIVERSSGITPSSGKKIYYAVKDM